MKKTITILICFVLFFVAETYSQAGVQITTPSEYVDISSYSNVCGAEACKLVALNYGATFDNPFIIPRKNFDAFTRSLRLMCEQKKKKSDSNTYVEVSPKASTDYSRINANKQQPTQNHQEIDRKQSLAQEQAIEDYSSARINHITDNASTAIAAQGRAIPTNTLDDMRQKRDALIASLSTTNGSAQKTVRVKREISFGNDDIADRNTFDYRPDEAKINEWINSLRAEFELYYENTSAYCHVGQFIERLYEKKTGLDIDEIINHSTLSDDDKRAIRDYNAFAKKASEAMVQDLNSKKAAIDKNELDMAFLANDVYTPGTIASQNTDWKPLTSTESINNMQIAQVINALNTYNNDGSGFYASMYKNDITGEYTLSFRGSVDGVFSPRTKDGKANVLQATGFLDKQYTNAASLGALLIECPEKINIVGHSKGGGQATLAGLISGFVNNTYTYNQADLNTSIISRYNVNPEDISKIHAYHSSTDPLTSIQPLANVIVNIGVADDLHPVNPGKIISNEILVTNVKKQNIGDTGQGHSMLGMQQYFEKKYSSLQDTWNKYHTVQQMIKQQQSDPNIINKRGRLYPQFE